MNTIVKSFANPDNHVDLEKVSIDSCQLCSGKIAKMTVKPNWKWSTCIKPIVQTEWCMTTHIGCLTQGQLHVVMKDGQEYDIQAGDCYEIRPEHDAWIMGEQEAIGYEFQQQTINTFGRNDSKKKD